MPSAEYFGRKAYQKDQDQEQTVTFLSGVLIIFTSNSVPVFAEMNKEFHQQGNDETEEEPDLYKHVSFDRSSHAIQLSIVQGLWSIRRVWTFFIDQIRVEKAGYPQQSCAVVSKRNIRKH